MTECPSRNLLASFLADELSGDDATFVTNHVDECQRCEEILAELCEDLAIDDEQQPTTETPLASNLLFGLLALHNSFISRADLVSATSAWLEDKSRDVADLLVQQKCITPDDCRLVDALVKKHLDANDQDLRQSIAGLSSLDDVRDELQKLNDPELDESISYIGTPGGSTGKTKRESAGEDSAKDSSAKPTSSTKRRKGSGFERDRFRELYSHAKGGLGEVFVAHDQQLDRKVALKRIQPRLVDDHMSRLRFEQEAEVTGKLEHPGIVPVYGRGADDSGRPFYAMRFIRGQTFKREITDFHTRFANSNWRTGEARIQLQALIRRLVDVCNTMEYAHHRGVLHRDLKPDNVMLGKYGETLLVDWGLAKKSGSPLPQSEQGDEQDSDEPFIPDREGSDSTPTTFGTVVGTLGYMSPEQAAGLTDDIGPPSDIYSLGAILYRLLTSQTSQEATQNKLATLERIERGEFPMPREIKSQIPGPLQSICLKAMALKPEDRYDTARQMAQDLEYWIADERVHAHQESISEKTFRLARRYRGLVMTSIAALAALAALCIAGLAARDANRSRQESRINLVRAQETVDSWLTGSAEDLRDYPGVQQFRKHLLQTAVDEYSQLVETESRDAGTELERGRTLLRLGDMHFELGDIDSAESSFGKAQGVFESLQTADKPIANASKYELANGLTRQGKLLTMRNEQSDDLFRSAAEIYRDLIQDSPDNPSYRNALGSVLVQRGAAYLRKSEHNEAEQVLLKAIPEFDQALRLEKENHDHVRGLSSARSLVGEAIRRRGNLDDAERYFRDAVKNCDDLIASDKSNRDFIELRADARTFLALVLRAGGRFQEELKISNEIYADYESLASQFTDVIRFQEATARSGMDRAQITFLLGDPDAAVVDLKKSLVTFEKLVASNEYAPIYQEELATCMDNLAMVTNELGSYDEALETGQQAVARFTALLNTFQRDEYQERLAVAQSHLAQVMHNKEDYASSSSLFADSIRLLQDLRNRTTPAESGDVVRKLAQVCEHYGTMQLSAGEPSATDTFDAANELWADVDNLSHENTDAYARFLVTYYADDEKQIDRAVELAISATKAAPNNPDFAATLGAALCRDGQFEKAIEQLKTAATLRSPNRHHRSFDLYFQAMAHHHVDEYNDAKEKFSLAGQLGPPSNHTLEKLRKEAHNLLFVGQTLPDSDIIDSGDSTP